MNANGWGHLLSIDFVVRGAKHLAGTTYVHRYADSRMSAIRASPSVMIYRRRSLVNYSPPRCRVHDLRNAAERPPKKNTMRIKR